MAVIDVHTHMFTHRFMELLKAQGGIYNLQTRPDGQVEIFRRDTPVAIPQRGHFDYELRLRDMDAANIDMAIVSLTCPNVYWGTERSVARRRANPTTAWRRRKSVGPSASVGSPRCPGNIRGARSTNWNAVCDAGAVGVMVLANIAGHSLTDPLFAPVWEGSTAARCRCWCTPPTCPASSRWTCGNTI